jgi:NAD(P)-dependent dehydrogenase (short-subunit alcohol dehydrogenase family)
MSNFLVVGASSGIGRQLAENLAVGRHMVYGTYKRHLLSAGVPNLVYEKLNVLDEGINLDFLPESLDGLAYCPGSISLRTFDRIRPADFLSDYQLQVIGAVKVIQAALPRLRRSEKASMVIFSTVAVQMGLPYHALVSASKGALEGLTRCLAAELAPRIRVNCIAPSLTDTPLAEGLLNTDQKREANANRNPMKKIGSANDIAQMAEFLLTEKSGWITGQVMHVDGGMASLRI